MALPTLNIVSDDDILYSSIINSGCKVNKCKLSDVTKDDNFYYLIQHIGYSYALFIRDGMVNLPEEVKYHITNTNLNVIYLTSQESPAHLDLFINALNNSVKVNGWKESQFYVIDNNSLIYDIKQKFNTNINFLKINDLIRVVGSEEKLEINEDYLLFDKKFIFLCLNRYPHIHRISLLSYLKNYGLLENDITDWSLLIPYHESYVKTTKSINHLREYIHPNDKDLIKDYLEITKQKKLSYYEKDVDWFDEIKNTIAVKHSTMESHNNSYINIVTESRFKFNSNENYIHITEKSFMPLYTFQIPIFLAANGHVKQLREQYDFYLFDELIDHSYDDEVNDVKRFHMVLDEIKRLSTIRAEISDYYKNNLDKLLHNHNFIGNFHKKRIEENYFYNLAKQK